MPLVPFAEHKLIPPGSNDPRIRARIGILHVDAGNAVDLYAYFKDRSGGIESHGHIRKDGHLYQYRDTAYEADANLYANGFATSWETQGFGEGEWTAAQLDTIKKLMLWHREAHDIPLRVVTSWNDPAGGWGYHTLFGAPSHWTPVAKSCPGPDRKRQFHNVLVPWMASQNGDDMALDDTLYPGKDSVTVRQVLRRLDRFITRSDERSKRIAAALHALAEDADDTMTAVELRRRLNVIRGLVEEPTL